MKDKISLAGDLGSGKSTVSEIIIKKTGAEYYSTGAIVRSIARERGMSVVELNKYMETHPEIDREIDDGLKALSNVDRFMIIDSRMAWNFVKDTFKVYLSTDPETSAARIMNAKRDCEHACTLKDTILQTHERKASEKKRYLEQYGVDIKDLFNYSLIIDTTYATAEEVADRILFSFEEWKTNRGYRMVYISPERLNYPDDSDTEEALALSGRLELGEVIPEVTVFENDGEFYVAGGAECAMAYALSEHTFVPARLVRDPGANKAFIKMKNSL